MTENILPKGRRMDGLLIKKKYLTKRHGKSHSGVEDDPQTPHSSYTYNTNQLQ
jgi:hypothetical protein